ncbi:hypothetical protein MAR_001149 [Mya arenaria]|uniref:Uncharacterized protein n=1 Tax=Mya arenaria TaxID=6604 RepID=A0ABY7FEY4_MYAAR|nr:hypothetical protein MAR_001149 [Mya arenaria]
MAFPCFAGLQHLPLPNLPGLGSLGRGRSRSSITNGCRIGGSRCFMQISDKRSKFDALDFAFVLLYCCDLLIHFNPHLVTKL